VDFIEPEGSLPHSQIRATCSYPETDQSSPCHTNPLLSDPFNLPSMAGTSKLSPV